MKIKDLIIDQMNNTKIKLIEQASNFKHGWKRYNTKEDMFLRIDTAIDSIIETNEQMLKSINNL